jgi:hypothetical protein
MSSIAGRRISADLRLRRKRFGGFNQEAHLAFAAPALGIEAKRQLDPGRQTISMTNQMPSTGLPW